MRSTVGPSRTSRPRSANGSMRNGWTRSSGRALSDNFKLSKCGERMAQVTISQSRGAAFAAKCHPACRHTGADRYPRFRRPGTGPVDPGLRRGDEVKVSLRLTQAPGEDALLHVQAVFRLVP